MEFKFSSLSPLLALLSVLIKDKHKGSRTPGLNSCCSGNWLLHCFFFLILFIYSFILFLVALGLRHCAWVLSSCGKRRPLLAVVSGLPIAVASPVAEHGLQGHRLQQLRLAGFRAQAQLPRGMWDPPGPGPEPASPALAGGLLTTVPPGKPYTIFIQEENEVTTAARIRLNSHFFIIIYH